MTSGGCTLPAEVTPSRREEILERVYRGGYRLRRIKRARWASAALAAVLVIVGIPALVLSSPGGKKTLNVAGGVTTTAPVGSYGVVTPYGGDGSGSPSAGGNPADGPTGTTAPGRHAGRPTTTRPYGGDRMIPVPPAQVPVGHWEQQNAGTTQTLRAVSFPDASHGWAVGDGGIVHYQSHLTDLALMETS